MPVLIVSGLLLPVWWAAPTRRKLVFFATAAISVVPAQLWYFAYVPALLEGGAAQLYFPTGLREGFRHLFVDYWKDTAKQFAFYVFNSYVLSAAAWIGLVASVARLLPTWAVAVLLLVGAKHGVSYVARENIYTPESYFSVRETVDRLDPSGAPLASTFDWDPRFSYYSARDTYGLWPGQFNDAAMQQTLREAGVQLLVLPRWPAYEGDTPYEKVYEDEVAVYYRFR